MTRQELKEALAALGLPFVDVPDYEICALYIDRLQTIRDYFVTYGQNENQNIAGIIADGTYPAITAENYNKVEKAFKNQLLLLQVHFQFYEYAKEAILADANEKVLAGNEVTSYDALKQRSVQYNNYYNNYIFTAAFDIDVFIAPFRRTEHALEQVQANYKKSVSLACERIITDWDNIKNTFFLEDLVELAEIESTGSDTHKQGLQVLILTFDLANGWGKLLYKPRDIEIDSLICGQKASLKNLYGNYFNIANGETAPLFESLNVLINEHNQNHEKENDKLELLTTFKFLPGCYATNLPIDKTIEDVYGYVEFLSHEENDYITVDEAIIKKFYKAIGQLMAITVSFSMCDLHCENVLVHNKKPYLIDLEDSLVKSCYNEIESCFDLRHVGFIHPKNEMTVLLGEKQNRLKKTVLGGSILPAKYYSDIRTGLYYMMDVLQKSVNTLAPGGDLDTWFKRMDGVISRRIPYNTQDWITVKNKIYNYTKCKRDLDGMLGDLYYDLEEIFKNQDGDSEDYELSEFKRYQVWLTPTGKTINKDKPNFDNNRWEYWKNYIPEIAVPTFFVLKYEYIHQEIEYLDVPSFYHKIGSLDLLMYKGDQVDIGWSLYIPQTHYNNFKAAVVSDNNHNYHYYSYPGNAPNLLSPTKAVIINKQLLPLLGQEELQDRKTKFDKQLRKFLFSVS